MCAMEEYTVELSFDEGGRDERVEHGEAERADQGCRAGSAAGQGRGPRPASRCIPVGPPQAGTDAATYARVLGNLGFLSIPKRC